MEVDDQAESGGFEVDVLGNLKHILNDYLVDQLFNELLQNADDARATQIAFVLDNRSNPPGWMAEKGLFVFNNSKFSERDWKNIRSTYKSYKEAEIQTIGKFGIGFRSCLHITDTPVVISGTDCLVLDPCNLLDDARDKLLNHGFRIRNFTSFSPTPGNRRHARMAALLDPILARCEGVCGFNRAKPFDGTLFLFPFRARHSELSAHTATDPEQSRMTICSPAEILAQFSSFSDTGAAKAAMLFVKHVNELSLSELVSADRTTQHTRILRDFETEANVLAHQAPQRLAETLMARAAQERRTISDLLAEPLEPLVVEYAASLAVTAGAAVARETWWLAAVVDNSGTLEHEAQHSRGQMPWATVAIQAGDWAAARQAGRVALFLPLLGEEPTGLPVHINGATFDVASNRRSLSRTGKKTAGADWNLKLIAGPVAGAYVHLIKRCVREAGYDGLLAAWPHPDRAGTFWQTALVAPLLRRLLAEPCLPSALSGRTATPLETVFTDLPAPEAQSVAGALWHVCGLEVNAEVPARVRLHLQSVAPSLPTLDTALACRHLRTAPPAAMSHAHAMVLLPFVLLHHDGKEQAELSRRAGLLDGLALLPTEGGSVGIFRADAPSGLSDLSFFVSTDRRLVSMCHRSAGRFASLELPPTVLACLASPAFALAIRNVLAPPPPAFLAEELRAACAPPTVPAAFGSDELPDWVHYMNTALTQAHRDAYFADICCWPTVGGRFAAASHGLFVGADLPAALLEALDTVCPRFSELHLLARMPVAPTAFGAHAILPVTTAAVCNFAGKAFAASSPSKPPSLSPAAAAELRRFIFELRPSETGSLSPAARDWLRSHLPLWTPARAAAGAGPVAELVPATGCFLTTDERGLAVPPDVWPESVVLRAPDAPEFLLRDIFSLQPLPLGRLIESVLVRWTNIKSASAGHMVTLILRAAALLKADNAEHSGVLARLQEEPWLPCGAADDIRLRRPSKALHPWRSEVPSGVVDHLRVVAPENVAQLGWCTPAEEEELAPVLAKLCLRTTLTGRAWEKVLERPGSWDQQADLLRYMDRHPVDSYIDLKKLFLPVDDPGRTLARAAEMCCLEHRPLLGAVRRVCAVQVTNPELLKLLGWLDLDRQPELLLQQLAAAPDRCAEVLRALQDIVAAGDEGAHRVRKAHAAAPDVAWFPLERGGALVPSSRVVLLPRTISSTVSLEPVFASLTDLRSSVAVTTALLQSLGVRELEPAMIVELMEALPAGTPLPEAQVRHLTELAAWWATHAAADSVLASAAAAVVSRARLPDDAGCLRPVAQLCLADSKRPVPSGVARANEQISQRTAAFFSIPSLSVVCMEMESTEFGQDIAQTAEMTHLLRQTIADYHANCEAGYGSFFKEMLQNASDAGAREAFFLLDCSSYARDSILHANMASLQGPALCAGNDAGFTEQDLQNWLRFASHSKEGDQNKIGAYGMGFATVYAVTDVPELVTAGSLHVLDPQRAYLGMNKAGRMWSLEAVKMRYPDQVAFLAPLPAPLPATLFRFPLRTQQQVDRIDPSRRICDHAVNLRQLEASMRDFALALGRAPTLFFLKSLRRVTFAVRAETGDELWHIAVGAQTSLPPSCSSDGVDLDAVVRLEVRERRSTTGTQTAYCLSAARSDKDWAQVALQRREAASPGAVGGAGAGGAVDFARAFYHGLPVPSQQAETVLPAGVHVNSHFVMDSSSRRQLCLPPSGGKDGQRNMAVLRGVCLRAYAKALQAVRPVMPSHEAFFALLPQPQDAACSDPLLEWGDMVLQEALDSIPMFPASATDHLVTFNGPGVHFVAPGQRNGWPHRLALLEPSLHVVTTAPEALFAQAARLRLPLVSLEALCKVWAKHAPKACVRVSDHPCPSLRSEEHIRQALSLCSAAKRTVQKLPLLLLHGGAWVDVFGRRTSQPVLCDERLLDALGGLSDAFCGGDLGGVVGEFCCAHKDVKGACGADIRSPDLLSCLQMLDRCAVRDTRLAEHLSGQHAPQKVDANLIGGLLDLVRAWQDKDLLPESLENLWRHDLWRSRLQLWWALPLASGVTRLQDLAEESVYLRHQCPRAFVALAPLWAKLQIRELSKSGVEKWLPKVGERLQSTATKRLAGWLLEQLSRRKALIGALEHGDKLVLLDFLLDTLLAPAGSLDDGNRGRLCALPIFPLAFEQDRCVALPATDRVRLVDEGGSGGSGGGGGGGSEPAEAIFAAINVRQVFGDFTFIRGRACLKRLKLETQRSEDVLINLIVHNKVPSLAAAAQMSIVDSAMALDKRYEQQLKDSSWLPTRSGEWIRPGNLCAPGVFRLLTPAKRKTLSLHEPRPDVLAKHETRLVELGMKTLLEQNEFLEAVRSQSLVGNERLLWAMLFPGVQVGTALVKIRMAEIATAKLVPPEVAGQPENSGFLALSQLVCHKVHPQVSQTHLAIAPNFRIALVTRFPQLAEPPGLDAVKKNLQRLTQRRELADISASLDRFVASKEKDAVHQLADVPILWAGNRWTVPSQAVDAETVTDRDAFAELCRELGCEVAPVQLDAAFWTPPRRHLLEALGFGSRQVADSLVASLRKLRPGNTVSERQLQGVLSALRLVQRATGAQPQPQLLLPDQQRRMHPAGTLYFCSNDEHKMGLRQTTLPMLHPQCYFASAMGPRDVADLLEATIVDARAADRPDPAQDRQLEELRTKVLATVVLKRSLMQCLPPEKHECLGRLSTLRIASSSSKRRVWRMRAAPHTVVSGELPVDNDFDAATGSLLILPSTPEFMVVSLAAALGKAIPELASLPLLGSILSTIHNGHHPGRDLVSRGHAQLEHASLLGEPLDEVELSHSRCLAGPPKPGDFVGLFRPPTEAAASPAHAYCWARVVRCNRAQLVDVELGRGQPPVVAHMAQLVVVTPQGSAQAPPDRKRQAMTLLNDLLRSGGTGADMTRLIADTLARLEIDLDDSDSHECPICFDLAYEPTSLPCGHRICHADVAKLREHVCPVCRAAFTAAQQRVDRQLSALVKRTSPQDYERRRLEQLQAEAERGAQAAAEEQRQREAAAVAAERERAAAAAAAAERERVAAVAAAQAAERERERERVAAAERERAAAAAAAASARRAAAIAGEHECPICVDFLFEPTSLPCGHNICLGDSRLLTPSICPLCRVPFRPALLQIDHQLLAAVRAAHPEDYDRRRNEIQARAAATAAEEQRQRDAAVAAERERVAVAVATERARMAAAAAAAAAERERLAANAIYRAPEPMPLLTYLPAVYSFARAHAPAAQLPPCNHACHRCCQLQQQQQQQQQQQLGFFH